MKHCKKRLRIIATVLLCLAFLFCLSGCARRLRMTDLLEKRQNEKTREASQEEEKKALETNPIEDPGEAQEIILNQCTGDFIAGYAIDESFLAWFQNVYGDGILEMVATAVNNDYQDVELWYDLTGNSMHVLWAEYCKKTGYQAETLENVYWKDASNGEATVIDFTGDINFSEGIATMNYLDSKQNGIKDCISEDLRTELASADITMVNNECTYSNRGTPIPNKDYTFRAKPERVGILQDLGVDIAGIANNHVFDYGEDALLDTIETLDDAEIPHVGAGKNLKDASEPVYFIINGRKIGFTAATQIERAIQYTQEATDSEPGVLKTLNASKYVSVLEETKKNCDYVIAFVHWGTEGKANYESDQKALAEKFVNAGADVIIGGHTHCLQGISYIDDVPIIYSLGNFWFSLSKDDSTQKEKTGVSQVIIDEDGELYFRFLPCVQENNQTSLVTSKSEKNEIFSYMEEISDGISIDEDGFVEKK